MNDDDSFAKTPADNPLKEGKGRLGELLLELRALLAQEMNTVRQRWNRSLPFADYIVDRWSKARSLGFGESSSVYDSALIIGDVTVGRSTWIGPFTVLDGSGGLEIGEHCSISAGVQIYTHDTVRWALSGGKLPTEYAPVRIGDRCYVGPNTLITKGVIIGNGCVIGANSLVLCDIPENSKAFGTPCRVVGPANNQY
jgi:acetyltransferase-like isoleucine patch superfamily enzyme